MQLAFLQQLIWRYSFMNFSILLDKDAVVSYETIYQKLKQESIFYGANDILEQNAVLS